MSDPTRKGHAEGYCSPGYVLPALIGAFALAWVIARAALQSITIDEADTYLAYIEPDFAAHWAPSSSNHILNTLLTRLSVSLFGASELTVRLPAIFGAAVFVTACWYLVTRITRRPLLASALMICLTCNPLTMDFLVAARGYSMAIGFLMAELAFGVSAIRRAAPWNTPLALASICAGLSFSANFSFAPVAAMLFLGIVVVEWRISAAAGGSLRESLRLSAAALPGIATALFFAGYSVLHWPKDQLIYGSSSVNEMLASVWLPSLHEVNEYFVDPALRGLLRNWRHVFPALVIAACLLRVAVLSRRWRDRGAWPRHLQSIGFLAPAALAVTLAIHWAMFHVGGILLPRGRTALYVAPLLTLTAGVIAALPAVSRMGRLSSRTLTASLALMAAFFLLCLRLNWFQEWRYNADVRGVYQVAAYYNHRFGVRDIPSCWKYIAGLNFYRKISGRETILEFEREEPYPRGRKVYILQEEFDRPFIEEEGLKVIYTGAHHSDILVAIRPELQERPPGD